MDRMKVIAGLLIVIAFAGLPVNINAQESPDLTISDITWSPINPAIGGSVTFTVTIKNQGSGDALSSYVYYYIDGSKVGYDSVSSIPAGGSTTETFTWKATAGSHSVKAVADADYKVAESDESNNEKTVSLSISTATPTPAVSPTPTEIPTATPTPTPEDTSAPAISIQSPVIIEQNNNGVLEEGEKIKITYGADDPSGVPSIKILLDETLLESQNQAGTYTVTTNSLSVGKHTIRVEATDSKSNSCFQELPITVERTGPSVYFGTTRTTINKGEDAIFTLSAVNPIGNPPMTVQLILKPPTGVSVTSSSFAKAGSGIYTRTQAIESGDNVRSIEVRLIGNQIGTHEIASEVCYMFEGGSKSPTRYETLMLVVDDPDSAPPTPTPKPLPGFAAVIAITGLLAAYLRRRI